MKCLECQKDLVQIEGKRKKKFCNSTCRSNYWQKLQTKIKENNKPENKKRILEERNSVTAKAEAKNPLTEMEVEFQNLLKQNKDGK